MVDKTQFKVDVPSKETIDEEEVKALNPSYYEGSFTMASDYHLTCDKVNMVIIPSHRYGYDILGCYALVWLKELQNLETSTFMDTIGSKWSQ